MGYHRRKDDRALDQEKQLRWLARWRLCGYCDRWARKNWGPTAWGEPVSRITIGTQAGDVNGEETVIRIGAKVEDEAAFVVKSSKSPYYVLAGEVAVADFIEQGLESLLASEDSSKAESST